MSASGGALAAPGREKIRLCFSRRILIQKNLRIFPCPGIYLAYDRTCPTDCHGKMKRIRTSSVLLGILFVFLLSLGGCGSLKSENEKLKEEITDVNAENEKLRKELITLKAENSKMHVRVAQLHLEIAALHNEIQMIQRDLDRIKEADKKGKKPA